MSNFFSSQPRHQTQVFSLDDALVLPAFKAVYEASKAGSAQYNNEWDANRQAEWRKLVRDGVINLMGEKVDTNFFNEIFGGNAEFIDAKKLYTKYNTDRDYNIAAASSATANAPGADVWVTLSRAYHSANGKYSYAQKGLSLYIYEDRQNVFVVDIDKSNDFAHRVLLRPYKQHYTINVRANKPMLVNPARIVNGQSSPQPTGRMQTPGYVSKTSPLRIRKDWKLEIEALKGYDEILQWAVSFDKDGNEIDCWMASKHIEMFEDMQLAENIIFYLGSTIDNPSMLGIVEDGGYTGFDGLLPTLRFGGGFVYDYDPSIGFSLETDYGQIILRQDALKETTEFTVLHGKNFMVNMVRNSNNFLKSQPGELSFKSFDRAANGAIEKYSIQSYKAFNHSLHFRELGSASDSRLLGNYDMPNLAICIASTGLKDSKGNAVKPIEFFVPRGCAETGAFEEYQRDMRKINGEEYLEGHATKTLMMQIHGAKKHILINPVQQ